MYEFASPSSSNDARRITKYRPASAMAVALPRLGRLVAVMALAVGVLTSNAASATAADDLRDERTDHLQGRIHTLAEAYKERVWDPDLEEHKTVARLATKTDIHNPYAFVAFRATVQVRVIRDNIVLRTYEYRAMACGALDPMCSSDRYYSFGPDPIPLRIMNEADRLEIRHF